MPFVFKKLSRKYIFFKLFFHTLFGYCDYQFKVSVDRYTSPDLGKGLWQSATRLKLLQHQWML